MKGDYARIEIQEKSDIILYIFGHSKSTFYLAEKKRDTNFFVINMVQFLLFTIKIRKKGKNKTFFVHCELEWIPIECPVPSQRLL